MADKKITQLDAYTAPIDTDVVAIVDVTTGVTKKMTIANLLGRLSPTGSVNGINQTFVFSRSPSIIFVDGVAKQKVSSDGTVNWTGTTTCVLAVAPTFDIFGI